MLIKYNTNIFLSYLKMFTNYIFSRYIHKCVGWDDWLKERCPQHLKTYKVLYEINIK